MCYHSKLEEEFPAFIPLLPFKNNNSFRGIILGIHNEISIRHEFSPSTNRRNAVDTFKTR